MIKKVLFSTKSILLIFLPFVLIQIFYYIFSRLEPGWSRELLLAIFTSNSICALLIIFLGYLLSKSNHPYEEKMKKLVLIIGVIFGLLILYIEIVFFQLYLGHDIGTSSLSFKGVFIGGALYTMLIMWPLAFITVPWATILYVSTLRYFLNKRKWFEP